MPTAAAHSRSTAGITSGLTASTIVSLRCTTSAFDVVAAKPFFRCFSRIGVYGSETAIEEEEGTARLDEAAHQRRRHHAASYEADAVGGGGGHVVRQCVAGRLSARFVAARRSSGIAATSERTSSTWRIGDRFTPQTQRAHSHADIAARPAANRRANRARRPMATPAGTWEVFLGGAYKPYDDPVQRALELAFRCGDASADVTIRGMVYEVTLQGAQMQQRQKTTRRARARCAASRRRRRQPPALAPAAIPAAPAVAAPAAPAPAAAGKRKRDVEVTVFSWNACHLLPGNR